MIHFFSCCYFVLASHLIICNASDTVDGSRYSILLLTHPYHMVSWPRYGVHTNTNLVVLCTCILCMYFGQTRGFFCFRFCFNHMREGRPIESFRFLQCCCNFDGNSARRRPLTLLYLNAHVPSWVRLLSQWALHLFNGVVCHAGILTWVVYIVRCFVCFDAVDCGNLGYDGTTLANCLWGIWA